MREIKSLNCYISCHRHSVKLISDKQTNRQTNKQTDKRTCIFVSLLLSAWFLAQICK